MISPGYVEKVKKSQKANKKANLGPAAELELATDFFYLILLGCLKWRVEDWLVEGQILDQELRYFRFYIWRLILMLLM